MSDQSDNNFKILALAGKFADFFETKARDNGDSFTCLKDGAPSELKELVRKAHCQMFPDDFKYATVRQLLDLIAECGDHDDLHDMSIDPVIDIYYSDQLAWLASHVERMGYCDEVAGEGLVDAKATMSERIAAGQYQEVSEIFHVVLTELEDLVNGAKNAA